MTATEMPHPNAPLWSPAPDFARSTNLAWLMQRVGVDSYAALHAWSVRHRRDYWALAIERLGIQFQEPYQNVLGGGGNVESPRWLEGSKLNIVESCFDAPQDSPAIIWQPEVGPLRTFTVRDLALMMDRVASGVARRGFVRGDALALILPMTPWSVAAYLGLIKAGCVVVGIAESFRPREIASRLRVSGARGVITQDILRRGGREWPLYDHVVEAGAPAAIVIPAAERLQANLRPEDCEWDEFIAPQSGFDAVAAVPDDPINILFSSGTTAEPKAMAWTHTTPIKCAADAHFHHDTRPGDVLVWPTSMGWMMGPWLVFASLMNRAAMGLFEGAPTGSEFCRFVKDSRATMLGVVPSIVKAWRERNCTQGIDWSGIRLFSSTGECANAEDMKWLSAQAGGRPVIEYCGGTEIGGAYLTGDVLSPCIPAAFSTPALGLDVVTLDESGQEADEGEMFIVPPSMGLSTQLINADHHEVYFAGVPKGPQGQVLRRHGDRMMRLHCGGWRALGRADDAMNLGGIKVGAAEIERALQSLPGLVETAAIAVAPNGGPSQLVICAVSSAPQPVAGLKAMMQDAIRLELNPLFRIHDVMVLDALPRTASNKVMRRVLRERYLALP